MRAAAAGITLVLILNGCETLAHRAAQRAVEGLQERESVVATLERRLADSLSAQLGPALTKQAAQLLAAAADTVGFRAMAGIRRGLEDEVNPALAWAGTTHFRHSRALEQIREQRDGVAMS